MNSSVVLLPNDLETFIFDFLRSHTYFKTRQLVDDLIDECDEKNPDFMKRAMDFRNKWKGLQKKQEKNNSESKRIYS